jgi:hypothetical protein
MERQMNTHQTHPATLAKLQPSAIKDATDIGEMLAAETHIYAAYWLKAARRLLVKGIATAPLSDRRRLISQLGLVDAALQVIEDARARLAGSIPRIF